MKTAKNLIKHPAETFLQAADINKATFVIDWNGVGESILGDLQSEMLKIERPDRIQELSGTFDEHRETLEHANSFGAEIRVKLNTGGTCVIACRATGDDLSFGEHPVQPDVIVADSDMTETAYWRVKDSSQSELNDLKDRFDEHYGGDPYFDGINLNPPLPGFEVDDHAVDGGRSIPRIVGSPGKTMAQSRTAAEMAKAYKSVPRQKPIDRQRVIIESLEDEVPLTRVCESPEEVEELIFRIKEAGIARGYSPLDMLHCCLKWNRNQTHRLSEATCIAAFFRHERMKALEEGLPDSRGIKPLFSMQSCRIDYFLDEPPPVTRWLLEGILPKGKVAMIAARGGTGKSIFALQIAVSIATGGTVHG